ncbi:hypothetical protein EDD99_4135 [Streptomyces sp. 846.5]|nr:hypothetical protein [Streptomyces sp. 846.5]TDU05610.1 hypothetical protein EDD99_4135 [Streptomyces sp. 846.5]
MSPEPPYSGVDLAQVCRALDEPLAAMSPEVMFSGCFGGWEGGPPLLVPIEQEWLRRVFEQAEQGREG